jgi:hypothetical protein
MGAVKRQYFENSILRFIDAKTIKPAVVSMNSFFLFKKVSVVVSLTVIDILLYTNIFRVYKAMGFLTSTTNDSQKFNFVTKQTSRSQY